jgi:hypothetical protein
MSSIQPGQGMRFLLTVLIFLETSWLPGYARYGNLQFTGAARNNLGAPDRLNGISAVRLSPDNRYLYATAFYEDAVFWFSRDPVSGSLQLAGVQPNGLGGSEGLNGAYALCLGSAGRRLYVAAFMENAISWFRRDSATGKIAYGGVVKDNRAGVHGLDGATALCLGPDGRHLYCASRNVNAVSWFTVDTVRPVANPLAVPSLPDKPVLSRNFTNPFNPATTIEFQIPDTGIIVNPLTVQFVLLSESPPQGRGRKNFILPVSLNIFNRQGTLVRTLLNTGLEPGPHAVVFDGADDHLDPLAAGIYLYRLRTGNTATVNCMVLLR